ncbi:unannotated protein [freshwater metagenome]|uniref:Unannotated protein n=1 Tax=freshwater metagenome TaxID=449393 RepID=A0A6J5ZXP0_9ZZZZ
MLKGVLRHVFAIATALKSAVGEFRNNRNVVVDPHRSKHHRTGHSHGTTNIPCPNRCGKAVIDIVGPSQRLCFIGELLHADNRTEYFALHQFRILRGVRNNGWRIEKTRSIESCSANNNSSATRRRSTHHCFNTISLPCGNHRTDIRRGIVRITSDKSANRCFQSGNKIIEHARPSNDTTGCGAILTRVVIASFGKRRDKRFDISVIEHNNRRLAAKFKMHSLQGVGRVARNHLAGVHIASERQHRNTWVTNNCIAR